MKPEERVQMMLEVYCRNINNPLERVWLKHDLLQPLAKLPEAVQRMVSQESDASRFRLRHLSKRELIEIEKSCTEALVLSRTLLNAFHLAGRIDVELKEVLLEKSSVLQELSPSTKSRLLQDIADDIWQNIFDALMDDPEVRKVRRLFLQDLFLDGKK